MMRWWRRTARTCASRFRSGERGRPQRQAVLERFAVLTIITKPAKCPSTFA